MTAGLTARASKNCAAPGSDAGDVAEQRRIAAELQMQVWWDVPFIPMGEYWQTTAYRKELHGNYSRLLHSLLQHQARLADPVSRDMQLPRRGRSRKTRQCCGIWVVFEHQRAIGESFLALEREPSQSTNGGQAEERQRNYQS